MRRKAFTLAELLVSVAVMTVITAGLWRLARNGTRSFLQVQSQAQTLGSAAAALQGYGSSRGLLKDIRRCSSVTSLQQDALNLSSPDGPVSYSLQSGALLRSAGGSTTTVAGSITALNFRYYSISGGLVSLATAPVTVAAVEISTLQTASRGLTYGLPVSARLRNRQ